MAHHHVKADYGASVARELDVNLIASEDAQDCVVSRRIDLRVVEFVLERDSVKNLNDVTLKQRRKSILTCQREATVSSPFKRLTLAVTKVQKDANLLEQLI